MAQLEVRRITEMFDYLSQDTANLATSDGAFVFGRNDLRLAEATVNLYRKNLVRWTLFTGGIGKDSGTLAHLGIPEAMYLASKVIELGLPPSNVFVEPVASNGAENCRLGLRIIADNDLRPSSLTVVAHATSLRRLVMMLQFEIDDQALEIKLQSMATAYPFDPSSEKDALEASQEMVRMADWPAVYGYPEDSELDKDLVAYARRVIKLLS